MEQMVFPKERGSVAEVFPSPADHEKVAENPPALVWLVPHQAAAGSVHYHVEVQNAKGETVSEGICSSNVFIPSEALPCGDYRWNVTMVEHHVERGWSAFSVTEDSVLYPRVRAEEILEHMPAEHPRHLFLASDVEALRKSHARELETLKRNVALAYTDGIPERPMFHRDPQALPYREYFGRFRDFCDRDMVACALGAWLLEDPEERAKAGAHAKALFLTFCDWNPYGPCALIGSRGDEVGLSMARCLPAVFDLLYPMLSPEERTYGAETIAIYAKQCEDRIAKINYMHNPGDSHVGRLPAYLGEAALVLWNLSEYVSVSPETLKRWLNTAVEIYNGMFPFYGSADGGWAEGTFYSTSYTRWYLPFFSAVKRFSGKSFFTKSFYRNYARYLLHFALPDHEIHPFGDGYWCSPDSPEWPGFFAQNPFRTYAALSGLPEAKAYEQQMAAPEIFLLHLLDIFLPPFEDDAQNGDSRNTHCKADPVTNADAFPLTGVLSLHSDRTVPEKDLHLIARASRFSSGSHRQPDQGSFALFYGGVALLGPSGYFGRRYGTGHHMEWYNTSKAHNTILVDGIGQHYWKHNERFADFLTFDASCGIPYGKNGAAARILSCLSRGEVREASVELTDAYPMLTSFTRTFTMTSDHCVEIVDRITADHPVVITETFHSLSRPEAVLAEEGLAASDIQPRTLQTFDPRPVRVIRKGVELLIEPEAAAFSTVSLSDRYDVDLNAGEPEEFHVTMPEQFHIYATTAAKCSHELHIRLHVRTL